MTDHAVPPGVVQTQRSGGMTDDLAWKHLIAAHELIGGRAHITPEADLTTALADVRRALEKFSIRSDLTADDRLTACRLLTDIHRHQTDMLTTEADRQRLAATEVAQVLRDVGDLPILELIQQIPVSVCARLGLHRSMISSVRSAVWLPRVLCVNPAGTPENKAFSSYVRGASIPLLRAQLETEIARRRAPAICRQAADDSRTFKEIVLVAETSAYVVAPIVVQRRVIGFLHADRPVERESIDDSDLEKVGTLSSSLAPVIERSLLAQRLHVESLRLAQIFDDASLEIKEGPEAPWSRVDIHGIRSIPQTSPRPERLSRPDASLTPRELETLGFLRTGATNAQIAAGLAVSESTVKWHVRRIFKKLDVTTRAAAVAKTTPADHQAGRVARSM